MSFDQNLDTNYYLTIADHGGVRRIMKTLLSGKLLKPCHPEDDFFGQKRDFFKIVQEKAANCNIFPPVGQ